MREQGLLIGKVVLDVEQEFLPDARRVLDAMNQSYRDYHRANNESTRWAEKQGFYLCWQWLVDQRVQFYQDLQTYEWKLGPLPLREVGL